MISRPTHTSDDERGSGDTGTAELAPVIATIEELVEGIARELSSSLDPHSLHTQLAARTADDRSLAQDLDAAGARIRELREQLWYAQAATHATTDSPDQLSDGQDTRLARYRELEPLFMRLESQIRQARQELRLREERDDVEPSRMKSPWLPADVGSSPVTKPGDGRSVDEAVSSVDGRERRQRWRGVAAAAAVLIATAIGSWFATRDVEPVPRSAATVADRTPAVANPSPPVVASPPVATDEPARPSEPSSLDQPVASSPAATATSGSFAQRPQSDTGSVTAVSSAVETATTSASARADNPGAPVSRGVTTTSSNPSVREAVTNTVGRDKNRPAEPTDSRAAADAVATPSQSPLTGAREDAAAPPPMVAVPSAVATQPPDTARTPPAEAIARAATPAAPPEAVARTAPPVETARADAPTDAAPTAEATPLNRPAEVLTRVQPRMMVEMISADMAAGVELRVRVDRTGRARDVRAVSGPVALRAPAEDTVRRWTFSPAVQNGEPVDGELQVTITFGASPRNLRLPRRSP